MYLGIYGIITRHAQIVRKVSEVMDFIYNFLKGVAIGIGAVAPGVSGGTLAVIFGIYEKINDAIANIFKNIKDKILFFLPIGLGGVVGVLAFSKIMQYLFANYEVEVKYLFVGLLTGTFPSLFRQADKNGFKKRYILFLIITLAVTIFLSILNTQVTEGNSEAKSGIFQLIMYGVVIGFGTIIPGISASFILMYLGAYELVLDAIANINLYILIFVSLGFGISIILFAKLIDFLFKKAYGYTYYAVLGFVIGSIIPIFPGIEFNLKYLFCLIIFIAGFYSSYSLSQIAQK